jgi:hypothetical protein
MAKAAIYSHAFSCQKQRQSPARLAARLTVSQQASAKHSTPGFMFVSLGRYSRRIVIPGEIIVQDQAGRVPG